MIFIEDLVGDPSAIDAAEDLYIGISVGFTHISRELAEEGFRELALKKSSRDIVSLELELVAKSTVDGSCKDGVEGEEKEMMIPSSGVGSLSVSRWRRSFHGTKAGRHSLKAMIREELEL